jgi:hypothetical protein
MLTPRGSTLRRDKDYDENRADLQFHADFQTMVDLQMAGCPALPELSMRSKWSVPTGSYSMPRILRKRNLGQPAKMRRA